MTDLTKFLQNQNNFKEINSELENQIVQLKSLQDEIVIKDKKIKIKKLSQHQ